MDSLRALLSHEALLDLQPRIVAEAESGALAPGRGVVALEPETHVDIRRQFYVLPPLDFIEDFHPLTYDEHLLLKVASLPLDEAPPPPQAGRFDAGIVFLLDTTMSMDPFIDRTGRALERIVNDLLFTDAGATVNFGVVGFRDNNEAVPGLEYRTRVLVPLERRTDQAPVLAAIRAATRVATVSSPGFNEDSLAGVEDALREIDREPEGDAFDARVIVLVTDAGPKDPRDPNARSDLGADELRREAQERRVPVMTLHLRTASGGAAQHAYAEAQYCILSRFEGGTYYYPSRAATPQPSRRR